MTHFRHTPWLTAMAILFLAACSEKNSNHTAPATLPPLASAKIEFSQVATDIKFDGVVEALNQATVSAQTSGRILELPVDVGDFVKKGDLIVRITDTEQNARNSSARAKLNESKAQFERMKDLLAKKLIAKADYDKAESAYQSAEAAFKESEQNLGYTAIRAPYAGIVVNRLVKVGETVAPGTPLMTGLSLEQLRIQVDIPQEHIGPVRQFKKALVILTNNNSENAASNNIIETQDLRIPPAADLQTHSFKLLVNLPQGQHNLFPGTLVKVAFVTGETQQLLLPASSIAQRGEMTGVYVKVHNEKIQNEKNQNEKNQNDAEQNQNAIEFRLVRLGSRTLDNRYPVLAGLSVGEEIFLDPIAAAQAYQAARNREGAQ